MIGNILQRRQQMRAEDLANQAAAQRLQYLQPSLQQQLAQNVARTKELQAKAAITPQILQQQIAAAKFKAAHPL
ncbi:MAG: hypothetical protein GWN62_34785, partial [Aliifodinibius sp.]|nr:hypothetical protein [Fodinibius sp.]